MLNCSLEGHKFHAMPNSSHSKDTWSIWFISLNILCESSQWWLNVCYMSSRIQNKGKKALTSALNDVWLWFIKPCLSLVKSLTFILWRSQSFWCNHISHSLKLWCCSNGCGSKSVYNRVYFTASWLPSSPVLSLNQCCLYMLYLFNSVYYGIYFDNCSFSSKMLRYFVKLFYMKCNVLQCIFCIVSEDHYLLFIPILRWPKHSDSDTKICTNSIESGSSQPLTMLQQTW